MKHKHYIATTIFSSVVAVVQAPAPATTTPAPAQPSPPRPRSASSCSGGSTRTAKWRRPTPREGEGEEPVAPPKAGLAFLRERVRDKYLQEGCQNLLQFCQDNIWVLYAGFYIHVCMLIECIYYKQIYKKFILFYRGLCASHSVYIDRLLDNAFKWHLLF